MSLSVDATAAKALEALLQPGETLLWADRLDEHGAHSKSPWTLALSILIVIVAPATMAYLEPRDVAWALKPVSDILGRTPDGAAISGPIKIAAAFAFFIAAIALFFRLVDARSEPKQKLGVTNERVRAITNERLLVVHRHVREEAWSVFAGGVHVIERSGTEQIAELTFFFCGSSENPDIRYPEISLKRVRNPIAVERLLIQILKPRNHEKKK